MIIALFSTDAEHLKIGFLEVDGTGCSELNKSFAHAAGAQSLSTTPSPRASTSHCSHCTLSLLAR